MVKALDSIELGKSHLKTPIHRETPLTIFYLNKNLSSNLPQHTLARTNPNKPIDAAAEQNPRSASTLMAPYLPPSSPPLPVNVNTPTLVLLTISPLPLPSTAVLSALPFPTYVLSCRSSDEETYVRF